MAWTSVGFDGTITEIQWAGMAGLLGNDYVAAGNGDCLVTAVPGARSVSVAAGSLYGDGVLSTNSGAETVAMTTPVNGQWYVIALRRTWATNTAALVAIAGATTTTTTPTAPPTSFPTLNTNKGVLTDQPIAWAWCNSANTTVVVYDIRLKPVKSLPPVVATSTERDAKFMSPTQGLQVWRDDLGAVETYYGLYNSSTNPGGRDTAGWYTDTRAMGLIPIRPTTATIVTGSGTSNALGVVNFTGATTVSLNGVFTSAYKNYRLIATYNAASAAHDVYFRLRTGASDYTTAQYTKVATYTLSTGATGASVQASTASMIVNSLSNATGAGAIIIDITQPATTERKSFTLLSTGYNGGNNAFISNHGTGYIGSTDAHDGFSFIHVGANASGSIQVFGYND